MAIRLSALDVASVLVECVVDGLVDLSNTIVVVAIDS